ncbi:hypothetical protein XENTR_v10005322 [Xenopus tropicalis]|nr:hypothetical protein XENTR_v10005322 [Xenopus tropicalis]
MDCTVPLWQPCLARHLCSEARGNVSADSWRGQCTHYILHKSAEHTVILKEPEWCSYMMRTKGKKRN